MKHQKIQAPGDEAEEERALIKQVIRAHVLTDHSTALCRDILSSAQYSRMSLHKMASLTDEEFAKEFNKWVKPK